ncbi:MAG: hypothetical protein KF906_01340 [Actinobacteria bacterium]|nr:hypothetical protein [Actinomycetota bacterium]
MAEQREQWRASEVLAWSRADGPDRPSEGPSRWALGALGITLAVVVGGIMLADTLCPEHRAWVQALATVSIALAIASVVQIMRAQASAGLFALLASLSGVAIGLIDAVHNPSQGRLVAAGFALAAVASAGIALRIRSLRSWDARLATAHLAGDEPADVASVEGDGPVAVDRGARGGTPSSGGVKH